MLPVPAILRSRGLSRMRAVIVNGGSGGAAACGGPAAGRSAPDSPRSRDVASPAHCRRIAAEVVAASLAAGIGVLGHDGTVQIVVVALAAAVLSLLRRALPATVLLLTAGGSVAFPGLAPLVLLVGGAADRRGRPGDRHTNDTCCGRPTAPGRSCSSTPSPPQTRHKNAGICIEIVGQGGEISPGSSGIQSRPDLGVRIPRSISDMVTRCRYRGADIVLQEITVESVFSRVGKQVGGIT